MGKYRKKPVEVEARQFRDDRLMNGHDGVSDIRQWLLDNNIQHKYLCIKVDENNRCLEKGHFLVIETLEGGMIASDGDYIIKGVKGEFYPCKPDIFEMTYDAVPE